MQVSSNRAGADTDVLTSHYFVPGFGLVPINAYVLHASEPVLVDTGSIVMGSSYLEAVRSVIPLDEIRWIWLTHADPDHIGSLWEVLEASPEAKVITTFLGLGKLGLVAPIPPERVHLLNPGERLCVGDRELVAAKPPIFDAPETTGFYDEKTRALFSSDCFGALLAEPIMRAGDIPPATLYERMVLWATIDAPWLASIEPAAFEAALDRVRELEPAVVFSSHLPPAAGMIDVLLENLSAARTAQRFVGPNQEELRRMLAPVDVHEPHPAPPP